MSPLTVPRVEIDRLYAHAREGYPHEVVGILAGTGTTVSRVQTLRNERADSPHNRYQVSGLALMRAEQALNDEGLEVLGYYHTHPDHPARYSDYDRDHALPNLSYVIVAVQQGQVVDTLSWRLREDRSAMDPQPLRIEEPHMATVHIPTPLRPYTGNQRSVQVAGATVGEALDALTTEYADLARHLRDGDGKLRSFVNVYLGDEDIRFLDKEATPLADGAEITIVPSIAGGAA